MAAPWCVPAASQIAQVGRNTQGVTLIRLGDGERLQAIERLDASLEAEEGVDDDLAADVESPMASPEA